MSINRVAAKQIIESVPAKLRNAARAERKTIIRETKKDPVGTSIKAAHGQFDFSNNIKLQNLIKKLNDKIASDNYKKSAAKAFVQRQPMGDMPAYASSAVIDAPKSAFVKASTYLGI